MVDHSKNKNRKFKQLQSTVKNLFKTFKTSLLNKESKYSVRCLAITRLNDWTNLRKSNIFGFANANMLRKKKVPHVMWEKYDIFDE